MVTNWKKVVKQWQNSSWGTIDTHKIQTGMQIYSKTSDILIGTTALSRPS
jgi:hypothetical protein